MTISPSVNRVEERQRSCRLDLPVQATTVSWRQSLCSSCLCFLLTPIVNVSSSQMSKSNAMILITHLKILDDVTLGNSFLRLNKNSRGLWSDFKRKVLSNKKFCALSILQTMDNTSFSILPTRAF